MQDVTTHGEKQFEQFMNQKPYHLISCRILRACDNTLSKDRFDPIKHAFQSIRSSRNGLARGHVGQSSVTVTILRIEPLIEYCS